MPTQIIAARQLLTETLSVAAVNVVEAPVTLERFQGDLLINKW